MALHFVGISGSLRAASYNTSLIRAAAELLPEETTFEIAAIGDLPLFNQDLEADTPSTVLRLRDQIARADALLIAVPEYNYSFSGALKNAIDWASRPPGKSPLNNKPVALTGAGGRFGTVRAQLQFRQVAAHLNMHVLNRPELMIPMAWEKFDKEGNLTDEATRKQLADVLAALKEWTIRLHG
jgi:chromate reductase